MDNELVHHGILGMRWGVRKNYKSLGTKLGEIKVNKLKKKVKKSDSKEDKKKLKEAENKLNKNKTKDAAKVQKFKNKISNNAQAMHKHKDLFSEKEMEKALKRFDMEGRIREHSSKDMDYAKKRAAQSLAILGTAQTLYTFYKSPLGQELVGKVKNKINNGGGTSVVAT